MDAETKPQIGLDAIATAGFRATAEADAVGQKLKDSLGFGAFYVPARLAIARSLSLPDAAPVPKGEAGRVIKGDTLFGSGADLAAWMALIVEHSGRMPADLPELQGWVKAHWARGMALLEIVLDDTGGDSAEFWRRIADAALPAGAAREPGPGGTPHADEALPAAISLRIGSVAEDTASGETVHWPLNAPGGNANAAFMGASGSGKTRTLTEMLRALRAATPIPLLAFDFKGDLTDDKNALDRAFGGTVLQPPNQPIPLDVLSLADRSPMGVGLAAQRLRDSLATLKGSGFGAVQKELLGEAAERVLRAGKSPMLADVRDALMAVYSERGRKEDGAISSLRDLARFPLFAPELAPAEFFRRSWVIRLSADLPDLVKVAVVTLITDALDRYANSLPDAPTDDFGNRALRYAILIDEAHRILGTRLPGLSGLLRVSRSKGGAVFLSSQSPDDFSGEDDEFLEQMGLVVTFRSNADAGAIRRILGGGGNLATLGKGEAYIKIGGEKAARKLIAWR
jgi:hypothetical protein